MDKINIGFIGGCINKQKNIGNENLYHAVLSKLLTKSDSPFDYQISLATYHSYDQLVQKTQQFISKKKLNIIFIFIRPFPLMPLIKPLVKFDKANGNKGWAVHPCLLNRKLKWSRELTDFQTTNEFVFTPKNKIEWRDINLFTGILLGLHHWASKYIEDQLKAIHSYCNSHHIKPIIISPPKNPESLMGNLICRWTTTDFNNFCNKNQIDFINTNLLPIDYFENDKIHFNISGHKKIGELLFDSLPIENSIYSVRQEIEQISTSN